MSITPFKSSCDIVPLFKVTDADMQSTSDQVFTKLVSFNEAVPVLMTAVPKTGVASGTCNGGVYSAAAKGGSVLLPSTASWIGISAVSSPKAFQTFGAFTGGTNMVKSVMTTAPYLSLTTGSSTACTADVYIYGFIVY